MDSAEKRLNELGYTQELRREMTLFKSLAITFSTVTMFAGVPLYGPSLLYAGPASLVWGWVAVAFFTAFIGMALAEICSSFPIIGGTTLIILLPIVALSTQPASTVFGKFQLSTESTGISSKPYAIILSILFSHFSLLGYDTAAHITEETKGADKNGPISILTSIGIVSVYGWAYVLALTFSIQNFEYLYDENNETKGAYVPAQILYDAFHGRYHSSVGAIIFMIIIWGSFFFGGLSSTTSAARVVYALSRDHGLPFSSIWRKIHPKHKVPTNAVWFCAIICMIIGLPIIKVDVVFTAIISICTIGWVGSYGIPIFLRLVMDERNFKPGPFYLGKVSMPVCFVAFIWICYTCSVFLLPTLYPIKWKNFNYAPVALGITLTVVMLWWILDARKWFKGPVRNISANENGRAQGN